MIDLRFLTIQQPWAWAIAAADKRVENRTWPTNYRGPLAIHAGKTDDRDGWCSPLIARAMKEHDLPAGGMPRGAVVAVAQLVGCHRGARRWPTCCEPWGAVDQFHFELADVQPLAEPVPMRGGLGILHVPTGLVDLILERAA